MIYHRWFKAERDAIATEEVICSFSDWQANQSELRGCWTMRLNKFYLIIKKKLTHNNGMRERIGVCDITKLCEHSVV